MIGRARTGVPWPDTAPHMCNGDKPTRLADALQRPAFVSSDFAKDDYLPVVHAAFQAVHAFTVRVVIGGVVAD